MAAGIAQDAQRNPRGLYGFAAIRNRFQLGIRVKQERSHRNGGAGSTPRAPGLHLRLQVAARQPYAALLFQFAKRRVQQIVVHGIAPAAWERPVSRPGIPLPLRAPHEQNRIRAPARMHDSHCRFALIHLRDVSPFLCEPNAQLALPITSFNIAPRSNALALV